MKSNSLYFLVISYIFISIIIFGCSDDNSSLTDELSTEEKELIKLEIKRTMDDYIQSVTSKDFEIMTSFWSNSEDFIHAGDGRVFGGYEKWINKMRSYNDATDEWLYWKNTNIHVIVLARNAAAYTTNFEYASIVGVDTLEVKGSWTYVFRKSKSGWQVVTSNGHHIGLSYYE
jgi:hypothetical protein